MITLAVSTEYRRVTDRQTDRQADILRQRSLRYAQRRALMLQPVMTIMLLTMLNVYDVHGGPKLMQLVSLLSSLKPS